MRIVIVLGDAPLPFGSTASRWYYVLVKGLSDRGHRVTALCACSSDKEAHQVRSLFPSGTYDVRCFGTRKETNLRAKLTTFSKPYSYVFSPEMERELAAEVARGVDILHMEQTWAGWVGLQCATATSINVHYTLERDLSKEPVTSLRDWILRLRLRQAERFLFRHYRNICCLTEPLKEHIQRINPKATVYTVPLGIDTSLYPYQDPVASDSPVTIGLIGSFNWVPSLQAGVRLVERLWPRISAQLPEARLLIVGRKAKSAFERHLNTRNIEIAENVPDTVPYFRRMDIMLYSANDASGIKVKVQEAFALGTPVVTSGFGVEGMPVVDGLHAAVGETDDALVEKTVALARDPQGRQRQTRAARTMLDQFFGPAASVARIEQICERILSEGSNSN